MGRIYRLCMVKSRSQSMNQVFCGRSSSLGLSVVGELWLFCLSELGLGARTRRLKAEKGDEQDAEMKESIGKRKNKKGRSRSKCVGCSERRSLL